LGFVQSQRRQAQGVKGRRGGGGKRQGAPHIPGMHGKGGHTALSLQTTVLQGRVDSVGKEKENSKV